MLSCLLVCVNNDERWLTCEQIAQHLASTYGDRAYEVAKLAQLTGKRFPVMGKRLHEDFPYIEAEVSIIAECRYSY